MLSIFFGILSALSWGAGDFTGGLVSRRTDGYRAALYSDIFGIIFVVAAYFLIPEPTLTLREILFCAGAGALGSTGLLILYIALEKGNMGVTAAISALAAALLPVTVSLFTEGLPELYTFIGFGFALLSVWLVSQRDDMPLHFSARLSDLKLPLVCGLFFGAYFVLIDFGTENARYLPMVISRVVGTGVLASVIWIQRRPYKLPRTEWGISFLNGTLDVSGNFFYILALQAGRLDVSAVLSSLYPGATVVLAWLLLKERLNKIQLIGIVCALGAIALITL